jgi:hypothetical protein
MRRSPRGLETIIYPRAVLLKRVADGAGVLLPLSGFALRTPLLDALRDILPPVSYGLS